jgi:hypothetical protein
MKTTTSVEAIKEKKACYVHEKYGESLEFDFIKEDSIDILRA